MYHLMKHLKKEHGKFSALKFRIKKSEHLPWKCDICEYCFSQERLLCKEGSIIEYNYGLFANVGHVFLDEMSAYVLDFCHCLLPHQNQVRRLCLKNVTNIWRHTV